MRRVLVQFYSVVEKRLMHPLGVKAFKLVRSGCVVEEGQGVFLCKPLPGYNTTTYIVKEAAGCGFECSCQGFQSKLARGEEPRCSHVDAVHLFLFWKHDVGLQSGVPVALSNKQTVVV